MLAVALSVVFLVATPSRAGSPATTTIRLVASATGARYVVDRPPKGYPNKGDVLREKSTLRNAVAQFGRPNGAIVGRDVWVTTIVIAPFGKADVSATTTLPDGTIRSTGTVTARQTRGTFRVVGGAGAYAGTTGTLSLRNINASGSRAMLVYSLRLP